MYRAALLLLFAGCLFDPVYACLNQSGTTLDGGSVSRRVSPGLQLRSYLNREVKSSGEKMELELRDKQDRKSLNDYAVALVFQGRTEEAISFLQEQEKSNPGDYSTAANLGTAYELAGKNELALKWIQEGMHRNPKSH